MLLVTRRPCKPTVAPLRLRSRGCEEICLQVPLHACAARCEFREALECAWQSHRFGREGDGSDRADVASITRCVSSRFHRPPKAVALPPHSKVLRTKAGDES